MWNLTLEETIKIAAKNGKVQTADVEQTYWNLWEAYYRLESVRSGRNAAHETWQKTKADSDAGSPEGQADLLTQAEQNYFILRQHVEIAQKNLFKAESALRHIMGQTDSDNRLIRPTDNPPLHSTLDKLVWENLGIQYVPMGQPRFSKHVGGDNGGFFDAGKVTFESVTEADAEESKYFVVPATSLPANLDHVYVMKTLEGKYAKFIVRKFVK